MKRECGFTLTELMVIVARAPGSLGPGLRGDGFDVPPQVNLTNRVITHWQWQCDGRGIKQGYLSK